MAGDFGELITPDQAAEELKATDPAAIGSGANGDAGVEATTSGFEVTGTKNKVEIPQHASEPLAIETQSGTLELDPVRISPAATDGEAVNDDSAVVYANTGTDSDTSVVPTESGVETFTNIRSEAASEDFSVKVDLPGDEQLKQVDDHTVAIVDPTPVKPDDHALPEPAQPGTSEAARARETSGLPDVRDPDPAAAAEARAGVEQAGTTKPDVPEDEIHQDVKPDEATAADLSGKPPAGQPEGEPDDTSAVDASTLEAAQAEAETHAEDLAAGALDVSPEDVVSSGPLRRLGGANHAQLSEGGTGCGCTLTRRSV